MKRNHSGSLSNYFKAGSHTTPAEVQKQSVAIENSSAINNDTTVTSNECNVQLNDGNNIVPKYDISLYVNKKMNDHEKINKNNIILYYIILLLFYIIKYMGS